MTGDVMQIKTDLGMVDFPFGRRAKPSLIHFSEMRKIIDQILFWLYIVKEWWSVTVNG